MYKMQGVVSQAVCRFLGRHGDPKNAHGIVVDARTEMTYSITYMVCMIFACSVVFVVIYNGMKCIPLKMAKQKESSLETWPKQLRPKLPSSSFGRDAPPCS